ncbi:MAG: hypothetical protein HDR03_08425 [Lachnospiraceae bacterium]|nr:hypothetical protein [Lachnospiraceae bacterium]
MAQYDGSIRIGTEIETKGFKAGSKELEANARRMAKTVSDSLGESAKVALQKQTDAFVKLNQQYANQEQKVKDLASRLHDLQRQKVETAEFKELSKDLDKAKASLDRLYERRDAFAALGKETPPRLELDISDAERKIRILEADIKEFVATDKAYVPVDTSRVKQEIAAAEQKQMQMYSALQTAADALGLKITQNVEKEERRVKAIEEEAAEEERLAHIRENAVVGNQRIVEMAERRKQLLQEIANMESAGIGVGYQQYDSAKQEIANIEQKIKDYNNGIKDVKESYRKLGQVAKGVLSTMASAVKRTATSSFGFLSKQIKKAASAMLKLGKSTKSTNNLLGLGFKSILKYGLGIRSIYALINKLRTAIKEGFTNLYNDKGMVAFKNSIDSLKASALTLKNAFAAAFRPLVEIAIPYIQKLTDYMINLMNVVGQFMAAITGQKKYTKAIRQTTEAIKDQNKAQNKQLSNLDNLNNLTSGASTETDGGAGTMFEEVPISDKLKDIVKWLKDMWENSDFYELGKLLGNKLKKALESIPWNKIKKTLRKVAKSIATLLNGFLETPRLFRVIGQTIAQSVNSMFEFLDEFVWSLHWDSLGQAIVDGVQGIIDALDWKVISHAVTGFAKGLANFFNTIFDAAKTWGDLGNTIAKAINTIIHGLYLFVHNFDFADFGKSIATGLGNALSNIAYWKLGDTLATGINGVFEAIYNFAETFPWTRFADSVAYGINTALEKLDWEKIKSGIKSLATHLAEWLNEFIEKTKWEDVGRTIGAGLQTAIDFLKTFVSEIKFSEVANAIKDTLKGVFEELDFGDVAEIILIALSTKLALNAVGFAFDTVAGAILKGLERVLLVGLVEFDGIAGAILKGIAGAFTAGLSGFATIARVIVSGIAGTFITLGDMALMLAEGLLNLMKTGLSMSKTALVDIGSLLINGISSGIAGAGGIGGLLTADLGALITGGSVATAGVAIGATLIGGIAGALGGGIFGRLLDNYILAPLMSFDEELSNEYKNFKWFGENGFFQRFKDSLTDGSWKEALSLWGDDIYNAFVTLGERQAEAWEAIKTSISNKISEIKTNVSNKLEELKIKWNETWEGFKTKISNAFNSIKTAVQPIIDWITNRIKDIQTAINGISGAAKSALGGGLGGAFGGAVGGRAATYNYTLTNPAIAALQTAEIPRLATGAVIPANREFLAVLGDQKRGTNVEAPLEMIKQANKEGFMEILNQLGLSSGGNGQEINLNLTVECEGYKLIQLMQKLNGEYYKQHGKYAFA